MAQPRTVEIIAHRGASRDRLENTLSAFRTALAQGADGIELDVHATRDRVVVVHHDPGVRRAAVDSSELSKGSSRGSLSLDRHALSRGSLSLDRHAGDSGSSDNDPLDANPLDRKAPGLQRGPSDNDPLGANPLGANPLDRKAPGLQRGPSDNDPLGANPLDRKAPGLRKGSSDNDPLEQPRGDRPVEIAQVTYAELTTLTLTNGEPIPTLDEVLALAAGKATVYIEVKGAAIEQDVLESINRHPNTAIAVHSFDHRIPHAIGQLDARVPLGILSSSYVLDVKHMIRSANARDLWQHTAMVDQTLIEVAHAVGARVVVWTENNFNHAIQLVQMGVDAICTDIPGEMRAALADAGFVRPNPVV